VMLCANGDVSVTVEELLFGWLFAALAQPAGVWIALNAEHQCVPSPEPEFLAAGMQLWCSQKPCQVVFGGQKVRLSQPCGRGVQWGTLRCNCAALIMLFLSASAASRSPSLPALPVFNKAHNALRSQVSAALPYAALCLRLYITLPPGVPRGVQFVGTFIGAVSAFTGTCNDTVELFRLGRILSRSCPLHYEPPCLKYPERCNYDGSAASGNLAVNLVAMLTCMILLRSGPTLLAAARDSIDSIISIDSVFALISPPPPPAAKWAGYYLDFEF
jgi:hypothetical protein